MMRVNIIGIPAMPAREGLYPLDIIRDAKYPFNPGDFH